VAVVIIGIAFVAILTAMSTSVIVGDIHARRARAETVAQSWAEQLIASKHYVPCANSGNWGPYLVGGSGVSVTVPTGYTTQISDLKYWVTNTGLPAQFTNTCPSPDAGLQQITLKVTPRGSRGAQTLTFLLRNQN